MNIKWAWALAAMAVMPITNAQQPVADGPVADGVVADATRASLERFLGQTRTLQAHFSQSLFGDDPGREALDESSGTLALKRPGRFRWNYTEPYEKTVVSDGKELWIYEPDLEQAIVRPANASIAANPAMLLSGDASLDEAFIVRGSYLTGDIAWLELAPRQTDGNFRLVRLGLQDDELRLMELVDTLDQITRITFTDVVSNPEIADSVFVFVPPAGADVQRLEN